MVTHADAPPVVELAAGETFFVHVEELRRSRYGWRPRKCERCRAASSEMIVRFWLDRELGTGQYLTVCRACLTQPEIAAWQSGVVYRIDAAPAVPTARRRRQTGT